MDIGACTGYPSLRFASACDPLVAVHTCSSSRGHVRSDHLPRALLLSRTSHPSRVHAPTFPLAFIGIGLLALRHEALAISQSVQWHFEDWTGPMRGWQPCSFSGMGFQGAFMFGWMGSCGIWFLGGGR